MESAQRPKPTHDRLAGHPSGETSALPIGDQPTVRIEELATDGDESAVNARRCEPKRVTGIRGVDDHGHVDPSAIGLGRS